MKIKVDALKINPEYEQLIPPLSETDFKNLEDSIVKEGLIYPLIINTEKVVLDGHQRLKIWKEHSIEEIKTEERTFEDGLEEKEFVISCNLNRRHLNAPQKAELGLILLDIEKERAKRRRGILRIEKNVVSGSEIGTSYDEREEEYEEEKGKSLEIAAKKVGLGKDTLWKARNIKKAAEKDKKIAEKWEKAKKGKTTVNAVFKTIKQNEQRENEPIPIPKGKFNVIYADPPWRYEHSVSLSREIENQYPTMPLEEICKVKIADVIADDSILFLWSTSPKLSEAMDVIEHWGFNYRTCMVWIKDKIGMGYYARQRHELLLIATRGNISPPLPKNRPDSVIDAPRKQHSKKPEVVYEIIERMYPKAKYLELFARNKREKWAGWGLEYGKSENNKE